MKNKKNSREEKLAESLQQCRVTCKCGKRTTITSKVKFVICDRCGNRVYKNDNARFKGELGKAMKKKLLRIF